MFKKLVDTVYSLDKSVKIEVCDGCDGFKILIYKLFSEQYQLFQIINYNKGMPGKVDISDNNQVIQVTLFPVVITGYGNLIPEKRSRYELKGSKYILTDKENT